MREYYVNNRDSCVAGSKIVAVGTGVLLVCAAPVALVTSCASDPTCPPTVAWAFCGTSIGFAIGFGASVVNGVVAYNISQRVTMDESTPLNVQQETLEIQPSCFERVKSASQNCSAQMGRVFGFFKNCCRSEVPVLPHSDVELPQRSKTA